MHATKNGYLAGTSVIMNDVDNVYKLERPNNIDPESAVHFEFHYESCRSLPVYDQIPFEAKLMKNDPANKTTTNWIINNLQ